MSCTEITLDGGGDFMGPEILTTHVQNGNNVTIAPWLAPDEDPRELPQRAQVQQRSFGFPQKASFSSFNMSRQASSSSLLPPRNGRTNSIAESSNSGSSERPTSPQGELRKAKSSINIFSHMIRKTKSKHRLRADSGDRPGNLSQSQTLLSHPHDPFASYVPMPSTPPTNLPWKGKRRARAETTERPPPLPPKEPEFTLDTNLDVMDGIVDLNALESGQDPDGSPSSDFTHYQSSGASHSDASVYHPSASTPIPAPSTTSVFSNPDPFRSSTDVTRRRDFYNIDHRKVSPKTIAPPPSSFTPPSSLLEYINRALPENPSWTAPESWAVEKDGEDEEDPESSSSESISARPPETEQCPRHKRKTRRKTTRTKMTPSYLPYKIRIHRSDNTYHVASLDLSTTVAEITPNLNQKLLLESDRVTHRLHLKERGRERILAQTEKPADIVRRRLEQAGYDVKDGIHLLGADDMPFLMKFVYKSQLLGPTEEDLAINAFEYIDLTGRSLRTIPVVLHKNAESIIWLNLSGNPMLEIPLDFMQSCITLRELRLSNMAIKKVPASIRQRTTLHRLDLSSNRIADLDDAALDRVPDLATLKVQNNRMEKLPWYFPRLRALKSLNISNNKFRHLPAVVCEMLSLVDLDVSFNMISELPEEIGQLANLQNLVIVGNQITKFPDECSQLVSLELLDCRRNLISDLAVVCMLPKLQFLKADHNAVHALDLSLGPCLTTLDASQNDITQLTLTPRTAGPNPSAFTSLDISHAKLSSLSELVLSQLPSLTTLKVDHNSIRYIPDSLGDLSMLTVFTCSDNELSALPSSIGQLQRLECLDVHGNSLEELPVSIWNCASLYQINVTSNLLGVWHDPPLVTLQVPPSIPAPDRDFAGGQTLVERKASAAGSLATSRLLPPLAHSLERLYLGENKITDDQLHPLSILKELRVLNLSFNSIQDMPLSFFRSLTKLEELYLSGNKLSTIPTEDLHRLTKLSTLFLNGNRLQTLPQELGTIQSLTILDVGSNVLKYNINNWEFDWNWNFNKNLKYLNLSGNKKLEIKPDASSHKPTLTREPHIRRVLANFSCLPQLRVLGLMDVTMHTVDSIPEDNEERRVRTMASEVNKMAYGIADHLGKNESLNMLDLVQPNFRDKQDEAVFAMFGRAQQVTNNNRISKFLHDHFIQQFTNHLLKLDPDKGEDVTDALRRTFLKLNKLLHEFLYATNIRKMSQTSTSSRGTSALDAALLRSGVSGLVMYIVDKTMYIANAGNALAVISRGGVAQPISRKHDPFDRDETARIRAAEGWVTPKGLVNEEVDVSRSFGFYHLLPVINARPDIVTWELSNQDEFVILANRGLWDYVSYQNAVEIAGTEKGDPMTAAQKLRDFAISYGAEGSVMIMVICVADLFKDSLVRKRQATVDSILDPEGYTSLAKRKKKDDIGIQKLTRIGDAVEPPTGHIALVFSDIRNSTHLWEANPGMPTALRLHNNLLRRQLRYCGGYEVKSEGDSFMCSFPNSLSALWWCLTVQIELLKEPWPLEILECEDGKEIFDSSGKVIARGLSVRMGIHCGEPFYEPDPVTKRMDYFGSMVNRSARISSCAHGGQITCSADVVREINAKILETEPETDVQPAQAIHAIKGIGIKIVPVGETKLKGLEIPESISLVYPAELEGRQGLKETEAASGSRVQFSMEQMRELALLCVRLETLSSSRVFRPLLERKGSIPSADVAGDDEPQSIFTYGDPDFLLPAMNAKASDADLMRLLDSLTIRIENALSSLCREKEIDMFQLELRRHVSLDKRTLQDLLSLLGAG